VRVAARLTGWKIDIKDIALYDPVAAMVEVQAQIDADAEARAVQEEEDAYYADEANYQEDN
jgi:transcription termination/antitermination protein NusA